MIEDKDKSNPSQQQRKNKYYAPVYTVRDRVSSGTNTNSSSSSDVKKVKHNNTPTDTKNNAADKDRRPPRREDGDVRNKERSRQVCLY